MIFKSKINEKNDIEFKSLSDDKKTTTMKNRTIRILLKNKFFNQLFSKKRINKSYKRIKFVKLLLIEQFIKKNELNVIVFSIKKLE